MRCSFQYDSGAQSRPLLVPVIQPGETRDVVVEVEFADSSTTIVSLNQCAYEGP